ncbi:5'/3'-nucleotidase SurE [candidate division KSB1 bacterium]
MMKNSKKHPRILLTNDDGIQAEGLKALYDIVSDLGECKIVAPIGQCSASGHGITIHKPIRVFESNHGYQGFGWALNGTPADCVKFAVKKIYGGLPDLIISGINQGSNTAINAIYSGTVAGAAEGGIMNIPSFAISLTSYEFSDFSVCTHYARILAKKILKEGLPDYTFLNVNVPPLTMDKIKGVKITHMGKTRYEEIFDERVDPAKNKYYWLRGERVILERSDDSDEIAVENEFVAITPLRCDLTNYDAIDGLKKWNISRNK